eukprot:g2371.t1
MRHYRRRYRWQRPHQIVVCGVLTDILDVIQTATPAISSGRTLDVDLTVTKELFDTNRTRSPLPPSPDASIKTPSLKSPERPSRIARDVRELKSMDVITLLECIGDDVAEAKDAFESNAMTDALTLSRYISIAKISDAIRQIAPSTVQNDTDAIRLGKEMGWTRADDRLALNDFLRLYCLWRRRYAVANEKDSDEHRADGEQSTTDILTGPTDEDDGEEDTVAKYERSDKRRLPTPLRKQCAVLVLSRDMYGGETRRLKDIRIAIEDVPELMDRTLCDDRSSIHLAAQRVVFARWLASTSPGKRNVVDFETFLKLCTEAYVIIHAAKSSDSETPVQRLKRAVASRDVLELRMLLSTVSKEGASQDVLDLIDEAYSIVRNVDTAMVHDEIEVMHVRGDITPRLISYDVRDVRLLRLELELPIEANSLQSLPRDVDRNLLADANDEKTLKDEAATKKNAADAAARAADCAATASAAATRRINELDDHLRERLAELKAKEKAMIEMAKTRAQAEAKEAAHSAAAAAASAAEKANVTKTPPSGAFVVHRVTDTDKEKMLARSNEVVTRSEAPVETADPPDGETRDDKDASDFAMIECSSSMRSAAPSRTQSNMSNQIKRMSTTHDVIDTLAADVIARARAKEKVARGETELALVCPEIIRKKGEICGVRLKGPKSATLVVSIEKKTEMIVKVWGQSVSAHDQGDRAGSWFDTFLGASGLRLVFIGNKIRPVGDDEKYAVVPGWDRVAFSDGYPLLLISDESLNELNRRLGKGNEVPMDRFRPNVTISDVSAPHAEDTWRSFSIGEIVMSGVKKCQRCRVPTTDQKTGKQEGFSGEPLKTLRTYRCGRSKKTSKGVFFGQNVIHHHKHESWLRKLVAGESPLPTISLGDAVKIHEVGSVPES